MTSMFLAMLLVQAAPAQQNSIDLEGVVRRATEYVTQYEEELGNLIGAEEYVQNSVWMDTSRPPKVARRLLVFINFNTDLMDASEWADDPRYPEKFSAYSYKIFSNAIMYAISH